MKKSKSLSALQSNKINIDLCEKKLSFGSTPVLNYKSELIFQNFARDAYRKFKLFLTKLTFD
jgi:hypothetical protein